MIELPDFESAFEYENQFYLSCDSSRLGKVLAHYELFKTTQYIPGAIVECGVFKGASLARLAMFRDLLSTTFSKKIIGFCSFDKFPIAKSRDDEEFRKDFIARAGEEGISVEQMQRVLAQKHCERNIELVPGDICGTVPLYAKDNPHLKIALLNLDCDVYEPVMSILEHFWPKIEKGGILMMDDYGSFPGETRAVDEFFKKKDVNIRKHSFAMTPCYIVKEE